MERGGAWGWGWGLGAAGAEVREREFTWAGPQEDALEGPLL